MVDLLFTDPMNLQSEAYGYPINHHRRVLNNKHSSMFVSAAPIAVKNKIRAIQTRKPRITLQSYYDFTDIRPLNIGNNGGITNSSGAFSNLSPEKLLERSKELRLARMTTRQIPRPSVLSTISTTNQPSLVWPSYNSPGGFARQAPANSPTVSPTALGPTTNKAFTGHMPDIHQRSSRAQTTARQPLTEQQNILIPVDSRHKSLPKNKSSAPKTYQRTISKTKSPFTILNTQPLQILQNDYSKLPNNYNNIIQLYESEEDENVPVVDEEFEAYVQKAMVKCADWLIKYVFDKTYDENDE
jgi:hypothetical protein